MPKSQNSKLWKPTVINYLNQNPFSTGQNITTCFSIDFLRVFIPSSIIPLHQINSFLRSLSIPSWLITRGKGRYTSSINGIDYIGYARKFFIGGGGYTGCIIQFYQPSKQLLHEAHKQLEGQYILSAVEYSIDMFCSDPSKLFGLVKYTKVLKWSGKSVKTKHPTVYAGNIRKSRSKGSRTYIKNLDGRYAVRIEMVLKRRVLKKRNVNTMIGACNLKAEQVFEHLAFRELRLKTINKKVAKLYGKHLTREVAGLPCAQWAAMFFNSAAITELEGGIKDINSLLTKLIKKGVYLQDHPFHHAFFNMIKGQLFV